MLLGSTGLVGGELLRLLLADDSVVRVVAPGRRAAEAPRGVTPEQRAKLDARIVDFDDLESETGLFDGTGEMFCALGTTIARAGSRARFRVVDHDYPLSAARLGLRGGASHFLLVSALGADPHSRIFYNRVKGETERDLLALGYRSVTIVRPSLLLGDRQEFRLGEEVAKRLAWAVPRRLRPVHARDVARALASAAAARTMGTVIIESGEIPRSA